MYHTNEWSGLKKLLFLNAAKAGATPKTETLSGSIVTFDTTKAAPLIDCMAEINPVQAGSGDPSPENVRPITGWTGAKVTRTGKNLLKPFARTSGIITRTDSGEIIVNGTSSSTQWLETGSTGPEHAITLPPGTYTLSGGLSQSLQIYGFYSYDNFTTRTEVAHDTGTGSTFTLTKPGKFYLQFQASAGTYNNQSIFPQFEPGSTATSYSPYTGETVDVQFPEEAGTVYGGTLDVTTGELVVDRHYGVIDKLYAAFDISNGYAGAYRYITGGNEDYSFHWPESNGNITLCNMLKVGNVTPGYDREGIQIANNNYITIKLTIDRLGLSSSATRTEVLTAMNDWLSNNLTVVIYPIATPLVYHLTPQEITTLVGTNNVWADTGDITVTYRK